MANKGVNTLVVEAKENLINAINGCIKTGIPVAMVSIIVESLLSDLNNNVKVIIEKEKEEYEHQLEVENNQVEYVPESDPANDNETTNE